MRSHIIMTTQYYQQSVKFQSSVEHGFKNGNVTRYVYSADVAKRISADEHFKDIPVVGANRSVISNGKDVYVGTPVYDNNKHIVDGEYKGLWITYKNGHQPFINGNYRGDQNLSPGTKNFSYETTWP